MYRANCNWKTVTDILGGKHIKRMVMYYTNGGDNPRIFERRVIKDCMIEKTSVCIGINYIDKPKHRESQWSDVIPYVGKDFLERFLTPGQSKPELTVESFCRISPKRYFLSIRGEWEGYMALSIFLKDAI